MTMSGKNLNKEEAKAPDLVQAGIDEATQAAQNDPGAVGTVMRQEPPKPPDISEKQRGL